MWNPQVKSDSVAYAYSWGRGGGPLDMSIFVQREGNGECRYTGAMCVEDVGYCWHRDAVKEAIWQGLHQGL